MARPSGSVRPKRLDNEEKRSTVNRKSPIRPKRKREHAREKTKPGQAAIGRWLVEPSAEPIHTRSMRPLRFGCSKSHASAIVISFAPRIGSITGAVRIYGRDMHA